MKKAFAIITIASLLLGVAPAVLADTIVNSNVNLNISISTNLVPDTAGGETPIVKAKWEANLDRYTDDDMLTSGAQFMPSGQFEGNKRIALCAIVTDPDGLSDIDKVYADVFYPEVALGASHKILPNQSGLGCGELMQEDQLYRLSKAEGLNLFCTLVRTNNIELPTIAQGYSYDEICATDGELQKETAAVYCAEKDLSYEDPSGEYIVWAVGQDKVGKQGKLLNHFDYLPVTAFQTDFNSITYGNVRLNTEKIISGDLTWGAVKASVRNVGNTRLSMLVSQNDMNFGKTNGLWNVSYKARVGSDATFVPYEPIQTVELPSELDLSELDEMDFAVTVSKFPPTVTSYIGTMTLSAVTEKHLECVLDTNGGL